MDSQSRPRILIAALGLVLSLFVFVPQTHAHVTLQAPNGGEVLEVDSVFTIRWTIAISHTLLNWDLWYSTTGAGGPWIEIASDLAPGSSAVGSAHSYDWTIPGAVSNQIRVRVRMDNSGTDYYDISNGDLTIEGGETCCIGITGDIDLTPGTPDIGDLTHLIDNQFINFPPLPCDAEGDFNFDGTVDIGDLTFLINHLFINFPPLPPCQ